jgi:hypothetical protein
LYRDDLTGTAMYGDYAGERSNSTFSIDYSALITPTTEVLFTTGNRSQFLVTRFFDFASQGAYAFNASRSSGNLCLLHEYDPCLTL